MFEDAPCGYICLSPDWRITQVNKTFLGWTGHDHDALYGRAISTDVVHSSVLAYVDVMNKLAAGEGRSKAEAKKITMAVP